MWNPSFSNPRSKKPAPEKNEKIFKFLLFIKLILFAHKIPLVFKYFILFVAEFTLYLLMNFEYLSHTTDEEDYRHQTHY